MAPSVLVAFGSRLADTLHSPDLLPLESRLRIRVRLEPASVKELSACLRHVLDRAGNPQLFTPGASTAVVEHSAGNLRAMMTIANDLLHAAVAREARQIDEKLFFEVFAITPPKPPRKRR